MARPPTKRWSPPPPPDPPKGWIPEGHVHSWSPKPPYEHWQMKWDNILGPSRPFPTYCDYCVGCKKFKEVPVQEEIARRKVLEGAKKQVKKEEEVEKLDIENVISEEVKLQKLKAKLLEVDEKLEVTQQGRGDVTPPPSLSPRRATGRKSPGAKAKNFARLLHYQDRLEEELCLPPSRLKESMSEKEGRMTPGSSPAEASQVKCRVGEEPGGGDGADRS